MALAIIIPLFFNLWSVAIGPPMLKKTHVVSDKRWLRQPFTFTNILSRLTIVGAEDVVR
jgi:hypothetical protein